MTIVIMGIAMAALVTGLLTAASKTDFERKDALAQTALRDYAESIKQAVLSNCPQNATGPSWSVLSPDQDSSDVIKTALNHYGITLSASPAPLRVPTTSGSWRTSRSSTSSPNASRVPRCNGSTRPRGRVPFRDRNWNWVRFSGRDGRLCVAATIRPRPRTDNRPG